MFVLVTDINGNDCVIKKSAIRKVVARDKDQCTILLTNRKENPPIHVRDFDVADFYIRFLSGRKNNV